MAGLDWFRGNDTDSATTAQRSENDPNSSLHRFKRNRGLGVARVGTRVTDQAVPELANRFLWLEQPH